MNATLFTISLYIDNHSTTCFFSIENKEPALEYSWT